MSHSHRMRFSYRKLQLCAIAISAVSVVYNGAEGGVSIGFGVESSSRSLVVFGVQSVVEVASALIVLWRFRSVAKPGEERGTQLDPRNLRFEKISTYGIGFLLICLSLATIGTAIATLVLHQEPDTSNASLIVSASALVLMVIIWLPKRYLARALNSSTMQGEATCSLSCIQMTIVLFIGSLVYRVWRGGWWLDGATTTVLGLLFGWEGIKMIRWAKDPDFDGGCCGSCRAPVISAVTLEEGGGYRDLCSCCESKEECRVADECACGSDTSSKGCCEPLNDNGEKCCSRRIIFQKPAPRKEDSKSCNDGCCEPAPLKEESKLCNDGCCSKPEPLSGEATPVSRDSCCVNAVDQVPKANIPPPSACCAKC